LAVGAAVAMWMSLRTQPRENAHEIVYVCFGLSIVFPLMYYYLRLAQMQLLYQHTILVIGLRCVAAIVIGSTLYLIWEFFLSPLRAATGVALLSLLTLVIQFGLVARLRIGAAAFQARELASPSAQFLYQNNFDIRNLEEDLKGQVVYKWPDHVREAMRI